MLFPCTLFFRNESLETKYNQLFILMFLPNSKKGIMKEKKLWKIISDDL